MRKVICIVAATVAFAGLLGYCLCRNYTFVAGETAPLAAFQYHRSGSSTDAIYTYTVGKDEETQAMTVRYDLNCGRETYTLPADEELLQALTALAADYNLREWDGFHKNNPHVMDGSGFKLQIGFADGTVITASGSNRFPEGYSDASHAIDELFLSYLEKQGVVREGGL